MKRIAIFWVELTGIFLLSSGGCKDKKKTKCGNGRMGLTEECDCGSDPNAIPPGCTDIYGGPDANCSTDCTRIELETGALCDNGLDDDGDGLTDCEDPVCRDTYFRCFGEVCNNGFDDDGGFLSDCDDPDCVGSVECEPEDCENGQDDNNNNHVDCQDEECLGHAACAGVEICWNHIDDNQDGNTDCDDVSCINEFACEKEETPSNPGLCEDGVDNDTDGWTDCADPGCYNQAPCDESTCVSDEEVDLLTTGIFQLVSLNVDSDQQGGDVDEMCGISGGKEKVIEIRLGQEGRLTVGYRQQGRHRYGLYFPAGAGNECAEALFSCRTPGGSEETEGLLDFGDRDPGTVFLIVAEAAPGEADLVELSISLGASSGSEICGNWADDDGDGQIDCGDLDCRELPPSGPFDGCNASDCVPNIDLGVIDSGDATWTGEVFVPDFGFGHSLSCQQLGAEDLVIGFTINATGMVELQVSFDQSMSGGGDHAFGVFFRGGPGTDCDAADYGCYDPQGAPFGTRNFGEVPGGQYYLVVKGHDGRAGNINVIVSAVIPGIEICYNGVDGDANNAVDCADNDCANWEGCVDELCGDSQDNDGDGKIDCADNDPDDLCSCSFTCDATGACDGGQTKPSDTDPEVFYLGECDLINGGDFSETIDVTDFYGQGQPARDDYFECSSVNQGGGTADAVLYPRILDPGMNVEFQYDNLVSNVYHLVEIYPGAHQCSPCNASSPIDPCNWRSPTPGTISGSWWLLDPPPGDYVFIVAPDMDYAFSNPNYRFGPMDVRVICTPRN